MRILDIIAGTSVDGPGLRTAIYFAGCAHHCPGCHNPQSWSFDGGTEMSVDQVMAVVEANGHNVTLTGGDPICQAHAILPLAERLHAAGYTIWLYTGYRYEELRHLPGAPELLQYIEVVVDGHFEQELRDISLRFRGSANQRLVDVARSGEGVVEWHDSW